MIDGVNFFRKFVDEMDTMLRENEVVNGKSQRQLLNELFKLEADFKRVLLSNPTGATAYKRFMNFILDDKKNKLSVRPYFRERQDTFSNRMFPILKRRDSEKLHRFRINYLFAKWILDSSAEKKRAERSAGDVATVEVMVPHYRGPHRKKLEAIYAEIMQRRDMLCENNLPLAIHWAKRFWTDVSKNGKSHMDYMDFIQESNRGLLEAIDNFVPPYRTVFRSTAIGRMGLNMSEANSSTLIKLSPKDRRILYRVRLARKHKPNITEEELVKFVNESFKGVTAAHIAELECATVGMASMDNTQEGTRPMSETIGDPNASVDNVERQELLSKLTLQLERLKIIEKKVLIMKHGELYGIFSEE